MNKGPNIEQHVRYSNKCPTRFCFSLKVTRFPKLKNERALHVTQEDGNNVFSLAVTTDGTCFDIIWLHDYQARHRARTAKCDSGIVFFIRGFASKRHLFISPHESPCWAELGSQSLALRWDLLAKTNNHLVFRIWCKICSDEVVPEDALQSLCGCRKRWEKFRYEKH